jgi:hypothetical protein
VAKKLTEDKENCQTVDFMYDYDVYSSIVNTKVSRRGNVHNSGTGCKAALYIT